MMLQGLLLTAIGMGTVFFFLLLLISLTSNLDRVVLLASKVLPLPGEAMAAPAGGSDLKEIAAAVFIAARLSKQAH